MERHGHLRLGPEIPPALLAMSAATINRSLREVREQAGAGSGRRRRRRCAGAFRCARSRTRTTRRRASSRPTWSHSGPVTSGSFVQTLVLTDIATGWNEYDAIPRADAAQGGAGRGPASIGHVSRAAPRWYGLRNLIGMCCSLWRWLGSCSSTKAVTTERRRPTRFWPESQSRIGSSVTWSADCKRRNLGVSDAGPAQDPVN